MAQGAAGNAAGQAPVAGGKWHGLHHSMMRSSLSRIGIRGALDKGGQTQYKRPKNAIYSPAVASNGQLSRFQNSMDHAYCSAASK
jgi:hypothetical protein